MVLCRISGASSRRKIITDQTVSPHTSQPLFTLSLTASKRVGQRPKEGGGAKKREVKKADALAMTQNQEYAKFCFKDCAKTRDAKAFQGCTPSSAYSFHIPVFFTNLV